MGHLHRQVAPAAPYSLGRCHTHSVLLLVEHCLLQIHALVNLKQQTTQHPLQSFHQVRTGRPEVPDVIYWVMEYLLILRPCTRANWAWPPTLAASLGETRGLFGLSCSFWCLNWPHQKSICMSGSALKVLNSTSTHSLPRPLLIGF